MSIGHTIKICLCKNQIIKTARYSYNEPRQAM